MTEETRSLEKTQSTEETWTTLPPRAARRKKQGAGAAERIYGFLAVAFGFFWLTFCLTYPLTPLPERFAPVAAAWLIWTLACGLLLCWCDARLAGRRTALLLLLMMALCALPRLLVWSAHSYVPTNDFANYLLYGQSVVNGDLAPAAALIDEYYQMPKMGGLAVFNGLLVRLFAPLCGSALWGMQLANILMASLICVALYLLVRPLHCRAALGAALLWMVWPSNLLSCQIPTNHHGAALCFLLALLLYQRALHCTRWGALLLYAAGTGLLLAVSNFIHPSVIVIELSIICFTALSILYYVGRSGHLFCANNRRLLAALALILFTGALAQQAGLAQLETRGVITSRAEISVLFKLAMGFNPVRGGSYVEEDYVYIRSLPQEEQRAACLALLRERWSDPAAAIRLMLQKNGNAWFARDGYFYWYREGARQEFSQKEQAGTLTAAERARYLRAEADVEALAALDTLFVRAVYLLAIGGLFTAARRFAPDATSVLFFIPLGWAAVIMLTEMQSRYRYPAMPTFFLWAALSVCALLDWRRKRNPDRGTAREKNRTDKGEIGDGTDVRR